MAKTVYRIPVRDDGEIVAHVRYNQNLDVWTGSNWQSGGTGNHLGLTMLKDGKPVLIYGTQWQGCSDSAEVVSIEDALRAVIDSDSAALEMILTDKKYAELAALYKTKYADQEREDLAKLAQIAGVTIDKLEE